MDFKLILISFYVLINGPDLTQSLSIHHFHDIRSRLNQMGTASTRLRATETADICVIGAGVSGLTAAYTAASCGVKRVVLLEAADEVGGRVRSDVTENGIVLDRGFAVFIEQYPYAQRLLDYNALDLGKFLPGALVKIDGVGELAKVSDPLRIPSDLFTALIAPVGSFVDKIAMLPLIYHVRTKSIQELFDEPETDTLTALKERWRFSNDIIDKFFKPFLEGIYLAPLEEQSSRMFSFVFKMFSEGAATLPSGGIGAVSQQLASKASMAGVDIRIGKTVISIENSNDEYQVVFNGGKIRARSVIVATEAPITKVLLGKLPGLEALQYQPDQLQRFVGCLYYSFQGEAPVQDPILILSGIGPLRGSKDYPINNICFPSVIRRAYAPQGIGLCSVTILKDTMDSFGGDDEALDVAVRKQLGSWFVTDETDILQNWRLEGIYRIPNAQPAQLGIPTPANVNLGRPPDTYLELKLPVGVFVCGDHMATATLNGALESGVNAGNASVKSLNAIRKQPSII